MTMALQKSFDTVIVGAGPGGSTLAAYLAQAGVSVLILEKTRFPRYHIGESLTGVSTDVVKDFGLEAEFDRRHFPRKGGVKVIGKDAESEFFVPVLQSTWQVRRAEFDQLLLENAIARGATYRQACVNRVLRSRETVTGAAYTLHGESDEREVRCRVLADASGQSALLSRLNVAGPVVRTDFDKQAALFSQFLGATRDPGIMGDNTFLFYNETNHWAWFIPVSPDVVSVGIVLPGKRSNSWAAQRRHFSGGLNTLTRTSRHACRNLKCWNPSVRPQTTPM